MVENLAQRGGRTRTSRAPTSCSRYPAHVLTWLNTWQEDGFRPVHDQWLFRAEGREEPIAVAHGGETIEGQVLGLDESANLLLEDDRRERCCSLAYIDSADLIEPRRAMKLLKTIRFDASDERVFELAAAPEEWAVSGAFAFAGLAPEAIVGKARQAFANGFLGLASFGRSTFATVAEATHADLEGIERALALHFVAEHGAPGLEAALPAAKEEARFVARSVPRCADQYGLHGAAHAGRARPDQGGVQDHPPAHRRAAACQGLDGGR